MVQSDFKNMTAPSVLTDNDIETRFAHLLNPIRDLSKNWDVDIASLLEKYLSELEAVSITFDGGKTTMNFVQAALLIQGSTCVYSRKVEFLYILVQEMLQLLSRKKNIQSTNSNAAEAQDKDASALEKEPTDDFLSLDDVPINKNTDLRDEGNINKKKTTLLSRTPTFFVPLDESEKGDVMFSPKGEQIGNRNDFKLGIAMLHNSGMLLLDVENNLPPEPDGKITPIIPHEDAPIITDQEESRPNSPAQSVHSFGGDMNNDVNDLDSPADVPEYNNSNDALSPNENENVANKEADKTADRNAYNIREGKRKDVLHEVNRMDPADPYENDKNKERPFKKGNVFKIVDELEPVKPNKRKVLMKSDTVEKLSKLSSFCSVEYFSDQSKFVKKTLQIPTYAELNRMYWLEQKERQKNLAAQKDEIRPVPVSPVQEYEPIEIDGIVDDDEGICDDFMAGGDVMSEIVDSAPVFEDRVELGPEKNEIDEAGDIDKLIDVKYEDLVRNHVERYMASAQKHVQLTELTKRVQEWEERILPILEKEEEAVPFDIHEYGSKVLNRFSDNNRKQTLTFKKVVENEDRREIARYFLASLQLANTYNVAISTHGALESSINTMELTLLSRIRHHEQLEDYVAPSLNPS